MIKEKGAEAIIYIGKFVRKVRNRKKYRVKKLDEKIRLERNRREFRILSKANRIVPSPHPLKLYRYSFTMERIEGDRPSSSKEVALAIGNYLSKLHSNDIIHGDLTPANLLEKEGVFYVIDFGLSFISKRIEDKADDLLTSLNSLKGFEEHVLKAYKWKEGEKIIKRMEEIKKRARYA